MTTKPGDCKHCGKQTEFLLHVQITRSYARNFVWVCAACRRFNPGGDGPLYISSEKVRAHLSDDQIAELPELWSTPEARCAHCGARGVEVHHWAPEAIFGKEECEKWPKDFLCKPCHDLWHAKVTPPLLTKYGK